MTDRDALVAAVAARPADDTPRLALADWLEEDGQAARAGFVRLQCRAARLRPGTVERADALRAADDLAAEHETDWLGERAALLVTRDYRRGFLHTVRMTVDDFLAHGEELFRSEPVRRLELVKVPTGWMSDHGDPLDADAVRAAVGHPAFARVRELAVISFDQEDVDPWLTALAAARHVTGLRAFGPATGFQLYNEFSTRFGLGRPAVAAFCAAPHLRTLRSLDLGSCPLRNTRDKDALAALVAGAAFARNLRRLNLSECRLTAVGFRRLAGDPVFRRLRSLDVRHNAADDPSAWEELFRSRTLTGVGAFHLGADRLPGYAGSPLAGQVQDLTVGWGQAFDEDGGDASVPWARLTETAPPPRRLALETHNPGRAAVRLMRRTGWLRRVRELDLSGDSQSGAYRGSGVFLGLFRPGVMPRLARLRLHEVGDPPLRQALAAWPGLSRLESLDLADDYCGRFRPADFPAAHPLTCLRSLDGVTLTSDEDCERFLALPGLENLTSLQLSFLGHYDRTTHRYTDAVVLTEATADRVIRSDRLTRLTELTLGFGYTRRVEFHVAPQLADPAVLPRLRKLRLYAMRDGSSADRPSLAGLRARFGLGLVAW
jgi:uncharacterized protein (TIGR02996 family)